MNKLKVTIFFLLTTSLIWAQAPEKFSFQFLVRNQNGTIVNQGEMVNVMFSILKGSAQGSLVYKENNGANAPSSGMLSLTVGEGEPISGIFSEIPWENGPFFLKIELDVSDGKSFFEYKTIELLSVAYAKYANQIKNAAPKGSNGAIKVPYVDINCTASSEGILRYNPSLKKMQHCDGTEWRNTDGSHYVGENALGGIIATVDAGGYHGLVIADTDFSAPWGCLGTLVVGEGDASSEDDGADNTYNISLGCEATSAGTLSYNTARGSYTDWFLPASNQLISIMGNLDKIPGLTIGDTYWSSTQIDETFIKVYNTSTKQIEDYERLTDISLKYRPVREY